MIEEYVFSKDGNIIPSKNGPNKPHMLARYHGGFLHPLIHAGYGTEFNLPGMVVEGQPRLSVSYRPSSHLVQDLHKPLFTTCGRCHSTQTSFGHPRSPRNWARS